MVWVVRIATAIEHFSSVSKVTSAAPESLTTAAYLAKNYTNLENSHLVAFAQHARFSYEVTSPNSRRRIMYTLAALAN